MPPGYQRATLEARLRQSVPGGETCTEPLANVTTSIASRDNPDHQNGFDVLHKIDTGNPLRFRDHRLLRLLQGHCRR